jgi:trimeric autotransporter adhesin
MYNDIQKDAAAAFLGGGLMNSIGTSATYCTLGGGMDNSIQREVAYSTLGGGEYNTIESNAVVSVLVGGADNRIRTNASCSFIGGGASNVVSAPGAVVVGGGYDGTTENGNTASGVASGVVGGTQNIASGNRSTIGGGHNNSATNFYATVPGGAWNLAGGQGSFAAGRAAKTAYDGTFVWNDNTSGDLWSTNANSVSMRASGGYRLFSGAAAGVYLAPNGTSWATISDRNAKKNFAALNGEGVLNKLAGIPIQQWNYKWEADDATPNLGPMAQDFKAAFYPGRDDKSITTLEYDGVELAAIQGLNQKLEQKETEITELKARLERLEQLVIANHGGGK